jgi:hypothetical protein
MKAEALTFNQGELVLINTILQVTDIEGKPRTFSLEGQAVALAVFNKLKATVVDNKFPEEASIDFTKEEKDRIYEYLKAFQVTIAQIEAKQTLTDKLK